VLFVVFVKSGKSAPLNPDPAPNGNVRVTWPNPKVAEARVLTKLELEQARAAEEPLWLSHFATCVHAAQHRRAR
jgi:hypothetical protein